MLRNNKKWVIVIVTTLLLLNLFFIYVIKYKNQNLSLSQFRFFLVGNILNLIFIVILIIAVIFYSIKKSIRFNGFLLITFSIIISLLLIIASISTIIPLPAFKIYIFAHPFNRIIIGALFFIYQFAQIILITYLWLVIFRTENPIISSIIDSIIIFTGLFIFTFLYSNFQKSNLNSLNSKMKGKSVAVVLGAAVWSHNKPSPSLEARVNKAVELYKDSIVDQIQLTGSNAPGELSEARVAFNYLLKKGIDPKNVWLEEKTTSTSEQIHFIKNDLIKKRKVNNIILISAPYHLARVEQICKFYNIKAYDEASDIIMSTDNKIYNYARESIALLAFWLFAL